MNLTQTLTQLRTQNPAEVIAAANQHMPFWISAVLAVWIAWQLANLLWAFAPGDTVSVADDSAGLSTAPTSPAGSKTNNYQSIVNAHIFGVGDSSAPAPIPTENIDAPDTKLDLELHGAIMADDKMMAHAIIGESKGGDEVYFIGDAIPGGAQLHQVLEDRVLLNRGGVLETLRLPKVAKNRSGGGSAGKSSSKPFSSNSSRLRDVGTQGPASFTNIVRPQPYMPNGQLKGYRIYPGRDRKQFTALGLRPGDLVTEINGIQLTSLATGMSLFQTLGDATMLSLSIERNGQPVALALDLNQVDLTEPKKESKRK